MIVKLLWVTRVPCFKEDVQYFGNDALNANIREDFKEDIKKYLGKDCSIIRGEEVIDGVIIGIEDNNTFQDYYYIVYSPEKKQVFFQLCNDVSFCKTIK